MKLAIQLISYGLIGAALAACGGGDGTPGGAQRAAAQAGGGSGTELAAEQVLHWGNGAEPQSLDPHKSEGVPSSRIQRNLFEGLVSEAANGDLVPGVAESWQVGAGGEIYTFELREDARWSNGDPVTAHDFVYGLRRSIDPATLSRYQFILYPIENAAAIAAGDAAVDDLGVEALDDHTLEIRLGAATPYFLGLLTHSATYPVHRDTVERFGERFTRPGNLVGNGAYMLDDWVVQSHVKLVRNPEYWNDAETTIDTVYMYNTEDKSAELRRYRAGELDITYSSLPRSQMDWMRRNLGDELHVAPYLGTYFYSFNMTRPPFSEHPVELRRALALAIDREIITDEIMGSGEIPAFGFVPPIDGYSGQQMPEAEWTQEEREAEARRLYAEAGFGADDPLEVEIMYNTEEDHRRIAIAIAAMWNQVLGVEASILNQEWKVFLDTRDKMEDTQVVRQGWIGDYNDPYTFLELYQSSSELNDTGYASPEYDGLLRLAATETDPDARAEHMQQAEARMLEDMPIMPIYFYVTTTLVKPWVAGFEPNTMDHHRAQYLKILKH